MLNRNEDRLKREVEFAAERFISGEISIGEMWDYLWTQTGNYAEAIRLSGQRLGTPESVPLGLLVSPEHAVQ